MTASIASTASGTTPGPVDIQHIVITNVHAGDTLICYPSWGQPTPTAIVGISDSVNGTWTGPLNTGGDTGDQFTQQWVFVNSAAGTGGSFTVTIIVTFDPGAGFICSDAVCVTGVTASPVSAHTTTASFGNSGANSVTSGNMTPGAQPALIVALAADNNTNTAPNAGTGFTSAGSTFGFAGVSATIESKRITSTTPVAATFTPNNASGDWCVQAMILTESGAAAVVYDANFFASD